MDELELLKKDWQSRVRKNCWFVFMDFFILLTKALFQQILVNEVVLGIYICEYNLIKITSDRLISCVLNIPSTKLSDLVDLTASRVFMLLRLLTCVFMLIL